MCVMVAGTGHDFVNRHSCNDGVFIRTTLLKDITWSPAGDTVRFGSGIVFSEAQKSASDRGRYVSSGWAITVGIAGWSTGGGHGPFAASAGLGVDNIVEAEIVTADGMLRTVNAQQNSDLWWALRGGGGSTWGVMTSLTVRAHQNPTNGFTFAKAWWGNNMCPSGCTQLQTMIDAYLQWTTILDRRWSGLAFFTPTVSAKPSDCGATLSLYIQYVFLGSMNEGAATWVNLTGPYSPLGSDIKNTSTWWEQARVYALENIVPLAFLTPSANTPGSVPSVLVSRENLSAVAAQIKLAIDECPRSKACNRQEIYHDITGQTDSPQEANVSISDRFRKAIYHYVVGGWNSTMMDRYYKLGENSYFSESAYNLQSWKMRYWGANYDKLLKIKQKYDPNGVFWCRNCVGSDL